MPEVLVWNDTGDEYQLNTIRNYAPIYRQEEQIVRAHLKIKNAKTQYTDEQISQFVENRISDNYVNPSDMVNKMNMFIVILTIEKHKLVENLENKERLTGYVSQFWKQLNDGIQQPDTENLADTMINDFSDLTGFRTNYKPLLRLRSLLKHYIQTHHIQTHHIQTQPHNYNSEQFLVDMDRYAKDAWYRYQISHGGTHPTRPHRKPSSKKRTPYKRHRTRRRRVVRRRTSTRKH